MGITDIKDRVVSRIDSLADQLWGICLSLYQTPEIAFQEYKSARLLVSHLAEGGFSVDRGIGGLETAFRARLAGGGRKPVVAFLAEYDALPGIGHACGHNLIASASIGAGLGMTAVMDELAGEIWVIGTPAEEAGGGKRILKEAGVFDDIDAAMMVHPSSRTMPVRGSLASARIRFEYFGKPSHAAASPEAGINALDACLLTFNNINAMRQHFQERDRVAGIIKHGGEAANIIPAYSSAEFTVRGRTEKRRDELLGKVLACAEAGAKAIGCRLEHHLVTSYANMVVNHTIADLFAANLKHLGRSVMIPEPNEPMGSTDMGDVSHQVPALHAYIAAVPENAAGHSMEFREACISPTGQVAMLDAAKALAMTAVDLLSDPKHLLLAQTELENALKSE